jgi:hypothetical protein
VIAERLYTTIRVALFAPSFTFSFPYILFLPLLPHPTLLQIQQPKNQENMSKLSPSPAGDLSGSYSDIGSQSRLSPQSQSHLSSSNKAKHESLDDDDDASSLASLLHEDFVEGDDDVPLSRLDRLGERLGEDGGLLDAKLDPQNWSLRRKVWVAVGIAFYT